MILTENIYLNWQRNRCYEIILRFVSQIVGTLLSSNARDSAGSRRLSYIYFSNFSWFLIIFDNFSEKRISEMNWIYDRRKSRNKTPLQDDQAALSGILNHWRDDLKWQILTIFWQIDKCLTLHLLRLEICKKNCQLLNLSKIYVISTHVKSIFGPFFGINFILTFNGYQEGL